MVAVFILLSEPRVLPVASPVDHFPMSESLRILLVEDQEADAILIQRELRRQGLTFTARRVDRDDAMIRALREFAPDVVISDFALPGFSGLEALAILRKERPGVPLIFVSGTFGEEQAVQLLELGATDYVLKDQLARLPASVSRALREARLERECRRAVEQAETRTLRTQTTTGTGHLPAGVAHDLNNLLAPIAMAVSMLRGKLPDPERERMLTIIEDSARRASEIVRASLVAGRSAGDERRPLEMDRVIKAVFQRLPKTWPENLRVKLSVEPDLWPVTGHAAQIEQAILDLCVGAGDAMPHGGTLHLSVGNRSVDAATPSVPPGTKPGRFVVLEISDTGEAAGRERSKVQEIIRRHGGFLQADSVPPGGGTTCRVSLPAARGEPRTEVTATATGRRAGAGECILLVDDEETIRFAAKAVLSKHGYRVLTARDGADALKVFNAQPDEIALVLTDLMMPVMGGMALVQAVRQIRPTMPVIMSSGQNEKTRLAELEAAGIRTVLNKPYAADILLRTVDVALGAPAL